MSRAFSIDRGRAGLADCKCRAADNYEFFIGWPLQVAIGVIHIKSIMKPHAHSAVLMAIIEHV